MRIARVSGRHALLELKRAAIVVEGLQVGRLALGHDDHACHGGAAVELRIAQPSWILPGIAMRNRECPRAANSPQAASMRFSGTAGQEATRPGLSGGPAVRARKARSNSLSV